jgi:succinate-acetate transporter protein
MQTREVSHTQSPRAFDDTRREPAADISTIPARISLQPIAPPSILGLYGFAGATFIVAAQQAGWFGNDRSALLLFPFAAFFGGLAQFMAGMWAYRARDGLATAMHGIWGSFWMAYGALNLLFALGSLTEPKPAFAELGFSFIALAAITWVGAVAALAENIVLTAVLGFLAAGSTVSAYAFLAGSQAWLHTGGWLFLIAALIAWYLATAMMVEGTWKRVVLPLGKYAGAANSPGASLTRPIQYERGMPGVKVGQ